MRDSIILPYTYFGPIHYFVCLLNSSSIELEQYEHYIKQTYRNRCEIYGANGRQSLVVPVKRPAGNKTIIKDVLVDYDENWPVNHFRSIESAYRSSPFYEFYIDEFRHVFENRYKYLIDLCSDTLKIILQQTGIKITTTPNNTFRVNTPGETDFRTLFTPKRKAYKNDKHFSPAEYLQVFSPKYGFLPNLSILDLLFNQGPNTTVILKNSGTPKT